MYLLWRNRLLGCGGRREGGPASELAGKLVEVCRDALGASFRRDRGAMARRALQQGACRAEPWMPPAAPGVGVCAASCAPSAPPSPVSGADLLRNEAALEGPLSGAALDLGALYAGEVHVPGKIGSVAP